MPAGFLAARGGRPTHRDRPALRAAAVLGIAGPILLACSAGPAAPAPSNATLVVLAASSLRSAMTAAATVYQVETGTAMTVSTDSSTTLRIQLEHGARADVYLAADARNPAALAVAGLIDGSPVPFAASRVVIVVPAGNPAGILSPFDLARPGVAIVAAGEAVPISVYADQLLARLAALPGAPDGFAAACAANVVSREDNVGSVLAKVELAEGDAAIVYATDAATSRRVVSIPIPDGAAVTATYVGAVPLAATDRDAAHRFLDWLAAPAGQAVLAEFGLLPPP